MKYFNHSEVSCFFVQNSSYIVEFQRAFPLSICTWILQFSSLKYRVWWTGFFPSLNWLYLVCKIQVWSRPKIQFIRLKDWKNQVGIDRIHIAFSFISSRIPNTMWAEFLMWWFTIWFPFPHDSILILSLKGRQQLAWLMSSKECLATLPNQGRLCKKKMHFCIVEAWVWHSRKA